MQGSVIDRSHASVNTRLRVIIAARAADLPVLRLAYDGLRRYIRFAGLNVITSERNFERFTRVLGDDVQLVNEDGVIPDMTLQQLRRLKLPGFPQGAGWYFQQFLKLSFAFQDPFEDYYLIWDADTVPLRSLQFFDDLGRMCFTIASEEHSPYLANYRNLLGEEPRREFSFISQHMIVQKSVAREMLKQIETNFSGTESWAWKIMHNLKGTSTNLFSEYEMLGHFVKNHYPDRAVYRELRWSREGALASSRLPSSKRLELLRDSYDFITFESKHRPARRLAHSLRRWLRS